MKFTYLDRNYRIRFEHFHQPDEKAQHRCIPVRAFNAPGGLARALTHCFLEYEWPGEAGGWVVVGSGKATCSLLDNFSKEDGRRIAIWRLTASIEDRELRRVIWETYRGRPRGDR